MLRSVLIREVAIGVLACTVAIGCGNADGTSPSDPVAGEVPEADVDYAASSPPGGKLERIDALQDLGGAEYGELAGDLILAEVVLSDTHRVTFWQSASGRITVIEKHNVDKDQGPALKGFRAGRDSYADAYAAIAGANADPAALERLRSADRVRAEIRAQRGILAREPARSERTVSTDTEQSGLVMTDGMVKKGVQEDWTFFQGICTQRNRNFSGEDNTLCYGAPLTPNPGFWRVTLNVDEYEEANIMQFNADSTTAATLFTAGIDCGILELGLCDTFINRGITTPPRSLVHVYNESDDGFWTTGQGKSFALHYVFWL